MREVAQAAGLGKSSLFHHFESKALLYGDVLGRVLSRIRERVDLVGGTVEVESNPGGGTSLFVSVPLAAEQGMSA